MDSILELLYHTTSQHPMSNPYYDRAKAKWDALEPSLALEVADAASSLKEEWGFSCFAAGLRLGLALQQELDGVVPVMEMPPPPPTPGRG